MFARMLANRAVEVGLVRDPTAPFVYLWDERLTSQAARLNIKIKAVKCKLLKGARVGVRSSWWRN